MHLCMDAYVNTCRHHAALIAYALLPTRTMFWVPSDLHVQDILLDRRKVYQVLVEKNIPVPTHIIVDRDNLAEGEEDWSLHVN